MKYKGERVKGRHQEIIPIPREGEDIIFIATAVKNWSEFDELVPMPQPPKIIKPGGVEFEDKNDTTYKKAMNSYADTKTNYLILASLADTPDLEWETVDMEKPNTWNNWKKELEESDFNDIEMQRITVGVMRANSLDDDMIDEARAHFLHGKQGSEKSS